MSQLYKLPVCQVEIDPTKAVAPIEAWRHAVGIGGINTLPIPEGVIDGIKKLRPRLIRIFIQEFFKVYPERGRFQWEKLDAYMDSVARMDGTIVAAITIKPKPLFPQMDENIWMPNDVAEWQALISQLVRRYSVDKKYVTHWEIGNETDIGEWGGCPYLITEGADYHQYYTMTIDPILKTFPEAKVGGPALANGRDELLPPFLELCRKNNTPLDFVTWHVYSDSIDGHGGNVEYVKQLLEPFGDNRPEMMVTEWNNMFPDVSVEEVANEPRQSANAAASLLSMRDAGLDWSFYYHICDLTAYAEEFDGWFARQRYMMEHWNDKPHRMGLFAANGDVRGRYFIYHLLNMLGDEQIQAISEKADVRVLAARSGKDLSGFIVNFNPEISQDRIVTIKLTGLTPSTKRLRSYRIDADLRWCAEKLEMKPIEDRKVSTLDDLWFQLNCPADTVSLFTLTERGE